MRVGFGSHAARSQFAARFRPVRTHRRRRSAPYWVEPAAPLVVLADGDCARRPRSQPRGCPPVRRRVFGWQGRHPRLLRDFITAGRIGTCYGAKTRRTRRARPPDIFQGRSGDPIGPRGQSATSKPVNDLCTTAGPRGAIKSADLDNQGSRLWPPVHEPKERSGLRGPRRPRRRVWGRLWKRRCGAPAGGVFVVAEGIHRVVTGEARGAVVLRILDAAA